MIPIPPSGPFEPPPADNEFWGAEEGWTPTQAACLLLGWEPLPEDAVPAGEARERLVDLRRQMEDDALKDDPNKVLFYYYPLGTTEHNVFLAWRVIAWAHSKGYPIPEELERTFLKSHPQACSHSDYLREMERLKGEITRLEAELEQERADLLPGYLDVDGKHFARELHAAISAWIAMFDKGQLKEGMTPKKNIMRWLHDTYNTQLLERDRLHPNALARVAIVANPFKTGDPPRRP